MKIGIYSPYLDTAGGGEKYILTIAESLSKKYPVDVFIGTHLYSSDINEIIKKITLLHKLDLSKVNFVKAPLGKGSQFFDRVKFLKNYDLLIYLSDGSFFYSTSKRNIIHFQVPFGQFNNSLWQKIKMSSWNLAIYNSNFTKNIIEKKLKITGKVVYPPVSVSTITPKNKIKSILSVGRFFSYLKDKKHELLIESFKDISENNNLKGWELNLVGGASDGDKEYIESLLTSSKGYPINILPNLQYDELIKLYESSQIYWHAMGFGVDDPEKMEHFGISTVEAMAGGAVPIVVKKGGLIEIVEDQVSGLFWESLDELKDKTVELITNEKRLKMLSENAIKKAKNFSKERFEKEISELIDE